MTTRHHAKPPKHPAHRQHAKHKPAKKRPTPPAVHGERAVIASWGTLTLYAEDYFNPLHTREFTAYADAEAPTVEGGYGKWQVIDRPLRTGLTTFKGYDPVSLTLPILFIAQNTHGSWNTDDTAGLKLETDIEALEWMGGRGVKSASGVGPTPLVYPSAVDEGGRSVGLIPFNYQPTSPSVPAGLQNPSPPAYVVSDIAWDKNPVRNAHGYRVRQAVVVTVTEHVQSAMAAAESAAERARATKGQRGKTTVVVTGPGLDTFVLIAKRHHAKNIYRAAQAIRAENPKLRIRSITAPIPHHVRVRVPVVL